eukprot:scaffold4419_cov128-Isochrysis_galbana.AAC.2
MVASPRPTIEPLVPAVVEEPPACTPGAVPVEPTPEPNPGMRGDELGDGTVRASVDRLVAVATHLQHDELAYGPIGHPIRQHPARGLEAVSADGPNLGQIRIVPRLVLLQSAPRAVQGDSHSEHIPPPCLPAPISAIVMPRLRQRLAELAPKRVIVCSGRRGLAHACEGAEVGPR